MHSTMMTATRSGPTPSGNDAEKDVTMAKMTRGGLILMIRYVGIVRARPTRRTGTAYEEDVVQTHIMMMTAPPCNDRGGIDDKGEYVDDIEDG
jgi:hypothetical protein